MKSALESKAYGGLLFSLGIFQEKDRLNQLFGHPCSWSEILFWMYLSNSTICSIQSWMGCPSIVVFRAMQISANILAALEFWVPAIRPKLELALNVCSEHFTRQSCLITQRFMNRVLRQAFWLGTPAKYWFSKLHFLFINWPQNYLRNSCRYFLLHEDHEFLPLPKVGDIK